MAPLKPNPEATNAGPVPPPGRQAGAVTPPTAQSSGPRVATPVYSLSTTARRIRPLSFLARLDPRLRFLPIGLFWGALAGVLNLYNFALVYDEEPGWVDLSTILPGLFRLVDSPFFLVILGPIPVGCLTATLMGSAMLKLGLSSLEWIVRWVVIGAASCVVGVGASSLAYSLWAFFETQMYSRLDPAEYIGSVLFVWMFLSLLPSMLIAVESTLAALLLGPLSLIARRLILRRRPIAESTSGASQTQL